MSLLNQVTPTILCFNEEANIARTLARLSWAEQVLIVDSYSTDRSLDIFAEYDNVRVVQREFDSFAGQWNFALSQVSTEWVLALDSDYLLTDELVTEITELSPPDSTDHYFIPFRYCVFGEPLRGTILPPRAALFRKAEAAFVDDGHRQLLQPKGAAGHLRGRIWHDDRKPLSRWLQNQDCYISLEAEKLCALSWSELGLADKVRKLIVPGPLLVLFVCLVWKGGILDGYRGVYYAFQRMLAEILLSLRLIERLRNTK